MKILRPILSVALLFSAGLWTVRASDNGIVTPESLYPQLDAILKQAIAQSPRMVTRAIDLDVAENNRIAAQGGLLPSVGGNYRFLEAWDKRADLADRSRVQKEYYDVSINQPIFHWGERRNNARMGEINENITKGLYREGYRQLAQEVRAQYLRLIMGKLRAKRAAYFRDYAVNQARLGEERLAKKVISEAQIFSIRLEAERAVINAERMVFDYENDKASFARLTGQPVLRDEEIPDAVAPVTPQEDLIQRMLAGFLAQKDPVTNEAERTRRALELERLNLANQKTRLLPKFNATAGISQDEQSYSLNVAQKYQVNSYYAGISINWTLFDGFSARSGQRNAYSKIRQLESDYRELTTRLAQTAQSQARLAGFNARYVSINDRLLTSSEGNLKAKQEEFSRGVIAEEAVSAAQMGVYDSQLQAYAARAEYLAQVGEFLGTIVEDPALAYLPAK